MADRLSGIHHIAMMSADIKKHIDFFCDVMGCKLSALFHMHGVPGGLHAFLELNPHCYFSIVQTDGAKDVPIEIGKTHSGSGAASCAPGTMQHLAFNVDTLDDLLAMRDRLRSKGLNVIGPMDHGMCHSIYFGGPDNMTLEIATSSEAVAAEEWIDPEVVDLAGISAEELARYKDPAAYDGPSGVAQPAYDPDMPHQTYPDEMYKAMLAMPDEAILEASKQFSEPPVKVA